MLKIWGRADGSNVIKAMWCVGELGIAHERIDWGGEFGGNDDPEYRRKNPNGRLPTLEEDDGWTLWESGAVVRYLCMKHSLGNLCPDTPRARADAEKWMDWSSLNFAGFNSIYLQHYFGPEAKRNPDAILAAAKALLPWLEILDRHLAGRSTCAAKNSPWPIFRPGRSHIGGSIGRRRQRCANIPTCARGTSGWRHARPTRSM
jgi:glutathione S-transferase